MNGFYLEIAKDEIGHLNTNILTNVHLDGGKSKNVLPGVRITFWGCGGDIHLSINGEESSLVLFGYVYRKRETSLYSQQEIINNLRKRIDNSPILSEIKDIASELNGSFSFIYISRKNNRVFSCTDRLSSRPIWSYKLSDELIFASNAILIAKSKGVKGDSPLGIISQFLYSSQVDPEHTLFHGITGQQEGSIVEYGLYEFTTLRIKKWYEFRHKPDYSVPISIWVNLISEGFSLAAERIMATVNKPLIFMSGGVDSRLAGAAFASVGGKPILCTLGDSNNLEIKVAKLVGKALSLEQIVIFRDDEWYLRDLDKAIFSSSGNYSWIHSHFSSALLKLRREYGVDAAILGDLCEAFSKLCFTVPGKRKVKWSPEEFWDEFNQLPLRNYRPSNIEKTLLLFQKDFRVIAEEELSKAVKERYSKIEQVSSDPLIIGDLFFRWHNVSSIATFQMFNDIRGVALERNLMFDKDLHRFLEILPSKVRNSSNLGAKIVAKLNPKLALIPNANTLLPLTTPVSLQLFAKNMRPILGKMRRNFFSNTYKTTASWPHLPLLYSANNAWRIKIEEQIFDRSIMSSEIFNLNEIEKCWQTFCDGDISRHSDVERLLGVSELYRFLKT